MPFKAEGRTLLQVSWIR